MVAIWRLGGATCQADTPFGHAICCSTDESTTLCDGCVDAIAWVTRG